MTSSGFPAGRAADTVALEAIDDFCAADKPAEHLVRSIILEPRACSPNTPLQVEFDFSNSFSCSK